MGINNPPAGLVANRLVEVEEILARHHYKRSELIWHAAGNSRSVPLPARRCAELPGYSPGHVAHCGVAVATFYAQFSLEPKGKYLVRVCDGTACHVKNSERIYDALIKKFKLREGKVTTADGLFTLETVACLGACGIAPVMVDQRPGPPADHAGGGRDHRQHADRARKRAVPRPARHRGEVTRGIGACRRAERLAGRRPLARQALEPGDTVMITNVIALKQAQAHYTEVLGGNGSASWCAQAPAASPTAR